jgi:hypothetical protein
MTHYYWYRTCPICRQGRLLIFKDLTRNELYLHCEECEWGWRDPDAAESRGAAFLTLDEEFESAPATAEDLVFFTWQKYAVHEFDE